MKVTYIQSNNTPLVCVFAHNDYNEKPGDFHQVNIIDLKVKHYRAIYSMQYFIDNTLDKNHEYYEFLKELINSKDTENLIMALIIINNI